MERRVDGHVFDFEEGPCKRCGITITDYQDSKTACRGVQQEVDEVDTATHRLYPRPEDPG
jgi:hypothetical protein